MLYDVLEKLKDYCVNENAIILEPQSEFNCGIIGVSEDKCHLIYDYEKLTCGMAERHFEKNKGEMDFEDCLLEVCEWVNYNTIRSIPYMNQNYAPIIIYEF